MTIETKEKTIQDAVYSVTQLPARRALRMKGKLLKTFGPSIAQLLMTSADPEESKPQENEDLLEKVHVREIRKTAVVKGIQLLATSIDEKTFEDFAMELLAGVRRDGVELQAGSIDHLFAGNLRTLYEVIFFVLEVNFGDFFQAGDTGIADLEALVSQKTPESKKSYTFR